MSFNFYKIFYFCFIFLTLRSNDFFDVKNVQRKTSYIYAPSLMSSELLMGRYRPSFISSTGEKIAWQNAGHIIGDLFSIVTFSEVNLNKPKCFTDSFIANLLHNVRNAFYPHIKNFLQTNFNFIIDENQNSDKSVINYTFDFRQANIAQEKDIARLKETYFKHLIKYPETDIVLLGDSRGSATTFNFAFQNKLKNVKAIILEGMYDDVNHCIKHFITKNKDNFIEKILAKLFSLIFGEFNINGPFPIQLINQNLINEIPILIVTSLKDGITAPQCAFNIYAKLKEVGYKKLHLLILKNSTHPKYMIDDENDKKAYNCAVHTFYRFYNLDHNSKLAQQGQKVFEQTQPTLEFLNTNYNLDKCKLCLW